MLWFFSDKKNILSGLDSELTEQLLACSVPTISTDIDENTTMWTRYLHPIHIMVFGVVISNSDVMPAFIFQRGFRFNTEAYIKWLEEVALL